MLVEWPQCTKLFEYMDLGVHIHPATEEETKVLKLLQANEMELASFDEVGTCYSCKGWLCRSGWTGVSDYHGS